MAILGLQLSCESKVIPKGEVHLKAKLLLRLEIKIILFFFKCLIQASPCTVLGYDMILSWALL